MSTQDVGFPGAGLDAYYRLEVELDSFREIEEANGCAHLVSLFRFNQGVLRAEGEVSVAGVGTTGGKGLGAIGVEVRVRCHVADLNMLGTISSTLAKYYPGHIRAAKIEGTYRRPDAYGPFT